MNAPNPSEEPGLLESRPFANTLFRGLLVVCGLLLLVDFLPGYHKHAHFWFEELSGFYAIFGALAYASIVNGAKLFRLWVKRSEDYYD